MSAVDKLKLRSGERIGVSGWKQVSQDRINRFADATDDFQFVHLDDARAARETPFGGTIAHGFLTLSLVSALAEEVLPSTAELTAVMLVAVDRVKFISPLRAESRVRGDFVLDKLAWVSNERAFAKVHVVIEVENQIEPAVTCDVSWLFIFDGNELERSPALVNASPRLDRVEQVAFAKG